MAIKKLYEPDVLQVSDEIYSTEYTFSWLINTPINNAINCTERFVVKEEDKMNSYEYDWNIQIQICKDRKSYCCLMWLEPFKNKFNEDKRMFISLSVDDPDSLEILNILENESVDLFHIENKIKKEIETNKYISTVDIRICINIHWKKNSMSSALSIFNQLSTNFENLYTEKYLTDVTFVFNNKEIKAHKAILMARSSVFQAMFQSNMIESRENCRIEIKDVDVHTFDELMRYIYSGKINATSSDKISELMVVADKYALNTLKDYCKNELNYQLNIENAADIYILGHVINLDSLKTMAMNFIFDHKHEVIETDGYKNLRKHHLHLIAELFEK